MRAQNVWQPLDLLTGLQRFWTVDQLALRLNQLDNMPQPDSVLRNSRSTSTLRPRTPKSIIISQERAQWRWQNLGRAAVACDIFPTLLLIVVFNLDPRQARLLHTNSDLRHVFDQCGPWPEERYAILLHLYRMVTSTAEEPVLELASEVSRLELWTSVHQSVIVNAHPLSGLPSGSVKAADIQNFLNDMGRPMDVSDIFYWNHQLWHTLPFQPVWRFPSPMALTLRQEGQVTAAVGTLQGILEQASADPAFNSEFLTPIALSRFSWATCVLQSWAPTAQAAELAFQAAHRIFECRTTRQGLMFLAIVVLVHYFLWAVPPKTPGWASPPGLTFDFSEKSFYSSLEALTVYIDVFDLQDVLTEPVFVRLQPLRVEMTFERVAAWERCLRSSLPTATIGLEGGDGLVDFRSGREANSLGPAQPGFRGLALRRVWRVGQRLVLRKAKSSSDL